MRTIKECDLLVIGGGAGGLNIASAASQLGLRVMLAERQAQLGGDCLHYGCVPSKTLIHSAKLASLMRRASQYGLPEQSFQVDMNAVNQNVQGVINHIQQHDDPQRFRSYGCEVVFGEARFISANEIQVGDDRWRTKKTVIAVGSRPIIPEIPGLDQINYFTNETIFKLETLPKKLIVLGGGPVGLELAQAFARLGSKVILLEKHLSILHQAEPNAVAELQQHLAQEGIEFHFSEKINLIKETTEGKKISTQNHEGKTRDWVADEVLVAVGRAPNIDTLHLKKAGITFSAKGITTDRYLRTSQKNIYAVGDAVDCPHQFTHTAEYHAGIVIAHALFRLPKKVNYRVMPSVIYTDPELAQIGFTQAQAKSKGFVFETLRFNFAEVDRALAEHETKGFVQLLVSKNKIIGATILGYQGGELLAEIALAMQANLSVAKISATIHAYPTLSQIIRRAVNTRYAKKLFSPMTKKLVKWLF